MSQRVVITETKTVSDKIVNFQTDIKYPFSDISIAVDPVQEGSNDPSPDNIRHISGFTGMNIYRCGKNILRYRDDIKLPSTSNGITFSSEDGVSITVSGTSTGISFLNLTAAAESNAYPFKPGMRLYLTPSLPGNIYLQVFVNGTAVGVSNNYFTIPDDMETMYIRLRVSNGVTIDPQVTVTPFVCLASESATSYEPYSGTSLPISWQSEAGTVYGGNLTINEDGSCVLTVDRAGVDLGTLTWRSWLESGTYIFNAIVDGKKQTRASTLICSQYKPNYSVVIWGNLVDCEITGANGNSRVYIRDQRFTDNAAFTTAMSGVQLVYELATPTTYTLPSVTMLSTLLGTNNIWADMGDITVTYSNGYYIDYISKVTYGNRTLIDLTEDTVAAEKMLSGTTAHGANGEAITGNIVSKAAATYVPTTTDQTITANQYLSGVQTIKGDANLVAENIKSGVEIFGITGTGESFTPLTSQEIYAAAASGWGSTNPSMSAAIWNSVAAGWSVSSTITDGQIEAAVSEGWR